MELLTKLLKKQLAIISKIADVCSVEKSRIAQDKVGKLMAGGYKSEVIYQKIEVDELDAEYIVPEKIEHSGIILYLHGGGYVSGGMEYARGFGTILAAQNHIKVCCVAYRLAPEHKFPAALDDAYLAYRYLLKNGYSAESIILCGESAGGGLVYSLALKIKDEGMTLPCGIIAISPWSDLTASGPSYELNRTIDPSMSEKRLQFYAKCYTDKVDIPYVSPLFGELSGMPPSLIFVGGSEIMLSDSVLLHEKLLESGCQSTLYISPEMWHIYLLYGLKETKDDYKKITAFIQEALYG